VAVRVRCGAAGEHILFTVTVEIDDEVVHTLTGIRCKLPLAGTPVFQKISGM
jgi:hypothetical protein